VPATVVGAHVPAPGTAHTPSALAGISQCRDRFFTLFAGYWRRGRYRYRARTGTFPGGRAARRTITRGHHNWDRTNNICGVRDTSRLVSDFAGRTRRGFHTRPDGVSTIDFGSMRTIGLSNSMTVAVTMLWWDAAGRAIETDQRYNDRKPWSTAAGPCCRY
jgi:hypothetical protein